MIEIENKLPTKPSALVDLALADVRLVEKNPRYRVYMHSWHDLNKVWATDGSPPKNICHVCLAGSVMSQTFKVPFGDSGSSPGWLLANEKISEHDCNALRALDHFRSGYLDVGLSELGIPHPDQLPKRATVDDYDPTNPSLFHSQMGHLADLLRSVDL